MVNIQQKGPCWEVCTGVFRGDGHHAKENSVSVFVFKNTIKHHNVRKLCGGV